MKCYGLMMVQCLKLTFGSGPPQDQCAENNTSPRSWHLSLVSKIYLSLLSCLFVCGCLSLYGLVFVCFVLQDP